MSATWTIRRDGMTEAESLPTEAVIDELETGGLTGDDFVRGDDGEWMAVEDHPSFAETCRQIEEANQSREVDETHLDMNPLIDVALVLLIFFILTTTYTELRKEIDPPPGKTEKVEQKKSLTSKELNEFTIRVKAVMEGERIRFQVEKETVSADDLQKSIADWIKKTSKARLAIEVDPKVPFKGLIQIQDAAVGAGAKEMIRVVPALKN